MTAPLRIGTAPEPFRGTALLLDGQFARPHDVALGIDEPGAALLIVRADAPALRWPLDDIRQLRDHAVRDEMILHCGAESTARLIVHAEETRRILAARCAGLHRAPPVTGTRRLLAWGAAALASVVAIVWFLVPLLADQLADRLPPEGEQVLGERTLDQIRAALARTGFPPLPLCGRPRGADALDKMTARLTAGLDLPYAVSVKVLDVDFVNAVALPGGQVVLFRGLLDAAETADEVAAVLAHELGHVAARDPTRLALRTAGSVGVLGLLLGDFAGGTVVLLLTERLIRADYTRDAEAAADSFAHALLARAGIPPSALAAMFERLRARPGDDEGLVSHFATHPALDARIAAARAADADLTGAYRPVLDAAEWYALRSICP